MTDLFQAVGVLRIMHLSDLHFGKDHNFRAPSGGSGIAVNDLSKAISEDLDLQGNPPIDALVISGDVMTQGRWLDYQPDAIAIISDLRKKLRLPPDRLYIVPGNHDYEWYLPDS